MENSELESEIIMKCTSNRKINGGFAHVDSIDEKRKEKLLRHIEELPPTGNPLDPMKARYKMGKIEVYFATTDRKYGVWVSIDNNDLHQSFRIELEDDVELSSIPGRLICDKHVLKLSGSPRKFLREIGGTGRGARRRLSRRPKEVGLNQG